jgi:hypothetical protein
VTLAWALPFCSSFAASAWRCNRLARLERGLEIHVLCGRDEDIALRELLLVTVDHQAQVLLVAA